MDKSNLKRLLFKIVTTTVNYKTSYIYIYICSRSSSGSICRAGSGSGISSIISTDAAVVWFLVVKHPFVSLTSFFF